MNILILLLTLIKSLKPYIKKYITSTLNVHEFLLVNNIFISLIVFSMFSYNYLNGKQNYQNIKKLNSRQIFFIILFGLTTIVSTFIFSKLENNNTAITNTLIKLFTNIVFIATGFILFNEKLTKKQMIGILFCGIGIYLTSKKN
jgi:uncharacterized membrane protein